MIAYESDARGCLLSDSSKAKHSDCRRGMCLVYFWEQTALRSQRSPLGSEPVVWAAQEGPGPRGCRWQAGEGGFDPGLPPRAPAPRPLPCERGCWSHGSAFPGAPLFWPQMFPGPFHETEARQGCGHALLRRQFGAVTLGAQRALSPTGSLWTCFSQHL